jgi:septum formation protein
MDTKLPVVLASGSPRRRELLDALGVLFRVEVSDAEEESHLPDATLVTTIAHDGLALHDHPAIRAWRKGAAVAALHPQALVLAADTIVVRDHVVLNKPLDADDARRMLRSLANRWHTVYTGVALFVPQQSPQLLLQASDVHMIAISDADIATYVASGEPLDKAGAYGIQGAAGRLVSQVRGSMTNVVGLPLALVHTMLTAHGTVPARTPQQAYAWWRAKLPFDVLPEASEI